VFKASDFELKLDKKFI